MKKAKILYPVCRFFWRLALLGVVLFFLFLAVFNTVFVQKKVLGYASDFFYKTYQKQLFIEKYHVSLQGITCYNTRLEGEFQDTLLQFHRLQVSLNYMELLRKKIAVESIYLEDCKLNISIYNQVFNFNYLLSATESEVDSNSTNWPVQIKNIEITDFIGIYTEKENQLKKDSLFLRLNNLVLVNNSRNILDSLNLQKIVLGKLVVNALQQNNVLTYTHDSLLLQDVLVDVNQQKASGKTMMLSGVNAVFHNELEAYKMNETKLEVNDFHFLQNESIRVSVNAASGIFQDSLFLQKMKTNVELTPKQSFMDILDFQVNGAYLKASLKSNYTLFGEKNLETAVAVEKLNVPYSLLQAYLPNEVNASFADESVELSTSIYLNEKHLQASNTQIIPLKNTNITIDSVKYEFSDTLQFAAKNIKMFAQGKKLNTFLNNYAVSPSSVHFSVFDMSVVGDEVTLKKGNLKVPDALDCNFSFDYNIENTKYSGVFNLNYLSLSQLLSLKEKTEIKSAYAKFNGYADFSEKSNVSVQIEEIKYAKSDFKQLLLTAEINNPNQMQMRVTSEVEKDLIVSLKYHYNKAKAWHDVDYLLGVPNFSINDFGIDFPKKIQSDLYMKGALGFKDAELWHATGNWHSTNLQVGNEKFQENGYINWQLHSDTIASKMEITSNLLEADATISGSIMDFANAYQQVLISKKDTATLAKHSLNVTVKDVDFLEKIFHDLALYSDFSLENLRFSSAKREQLDLDFSIDKLVYDKYLLNNLHAKANLDTSSVRLQLETDTMKYDRMKVRGFYVESLIKDSLKTAVLYLKDGQKNTFFSLGGTFSLLENAYLFAFHDTVVVDYQPYVFEKNNHIRFDALGNLQANVRLETGNKKLNLQATRNENKKSTINFTLENMDLAYLFEVFHIDSAKAIVSAKVNGEFDGEDFAGQMNLQIDSVNYQRTKLKSMAFSSEMHTENKQFYYELAGIIEENARINSSGSIGEKIAVNANFSEVDLRLMNFYDAYYYNEKGRLNAKIALHGYCDNPLFDAVLEIDDASVVVVPLGNKFELKQVYINADRKGIYFNQMKIQDQKQGVFTLNGNVMQQGNDFVADLKVKCDKMLLMQTSSKDSKYFYGTLLSDFSATVKGSVFSPNVKGSLKLLSGSTLTMVGKENLESSKKMGVVSFVSKTDSVQTTVSGRFPKFALGDTELKISVDENTQFKYLFAEEADEYVQFKGGGNLVYYAKNDGQESLLGQFNLRQGTVAIKPSLMIRREFKIDPSSKIVWDGLLDNPLLDLTGVYSVRSSTAGLLDGLGNRSEPFDVLIMADQRLDNKRIRFDVRSRGEVQTALAKLSNEERNMQALSLLLFGTLDRANNEKSSKNTQLNSMLSQQLSNWADNKIKGVEVEIDVETYQQQSASGTIEKSDVNYRFKKEVNEQLSVQVGGRVTSQKEANSGSSILGDVIIAYYLNEKKNTALKAFTENTYEGVLDGDVTKTGVGFSTQKKFLRSKDIKLKKRKYEIKEVR